MEIKNLKINLHLLGHSDSTSFNWWSKSVGSKHIYTYFDYWFKYSNLRDLADVLLSILWVIALLRKSFDNIFYLI